MRCLAEALTRVVRDSRRILVPLHTAPDGDSVGSCVAAAWAVEELGADAVVVSADPIPHKYRFISEGERSILRPEDVDGPFDLLLLLDCSALDRIGRSADLLTPATNIFSVDHHRRGGNAGDWIWSDAEASATAEMLMTWFDSSSLTPTPFVASCLYTGIATDTGFFAYANTSAATLRTAARLLELGASPQRIHSEVNEHRTLGEIRLLGRALEEMEVEAEGKIAWTVLDDEQFTRADAGTEETEGIINLLRALDGVEIAAVFMSLGGSPVKVSFRSRGRIDVGELAASFGGGGHDRAAGCSLDTSLSDALDRVLSRMRLAVERLQ